LQQLIDHSSIVDEPLVLENISFMHSEIGKGFREGYARILLDNMVDGIIIFDEFWKIQGINPVAEKFFSYTADEAQEECINILIPKLSPGTCSQFMKNGNEDDSEQGFGKEVTGICKNGFAISLNLLVNKIDFNGCFLFIAIFRKL
jgi:PAS domain S-box-containing protein